VGRKKPLTQTDPELAALYRAVVAEPEDDLPRLVLADWLDDHGHAARAAFIREQVRDPTLSIRGFRCMQRIGVIEPVSGGHVQLARYVSRASLHKMNAFPMFRRGFVSEVVLPLQQFLTNHHWLVAAYPLTRVSFTDKWPDQSYDRNGVRRHYWNRVESLSQMPSWVPEPVFKLLKHTSYETTAQAAADLSQAMLKLARLPF